MRTTLSAAFADQGARSDGGGLCFWYQATRMARASASCRYRMGHLAEHLRAATTIVDRDPPLSELRDADVLLVMRPFVDDACEAILDACRRRGVLLVADFDDLLFAGDPAEYPLVLGGSLTAEQSGARMRRYQIGLSEFDAFTVATAELESDLALTKPGARIAHVWNGLSPSWVEQGRALYRAWQPGDPKVIRYFSGSPSHRADFARIAPTVELFLRAHPDVTLEIVGALDDRTPAQRARVPYMELPRLLASSWTTLAPLAPTRFNACKSAIKFLESAAFGAPCIASSIGDLARHHEGGVILVDVEAEWHDALTRLLDDEYRMALAQRGRAYVDAHGLARHGTRALLGALDRWRTH